MDNKLELIKEYLTRHTDHPPENITLDSTLDDLGLDSMSLLELIFEFEEKYDVRIPDNMPTPKTVLELINLINEYQSSTVNE